MYIDSQEEFSVNQSLVGTGAIVSTNSYDTGAAADVGIGNKVTSVFANLTAAMVGGTSVQVILQTSPDNATWTQAGAGPVVPVAEATIGKRIASFPLPTGLKRYLRVVYQVVGTNTAGLVNCSLVLDVDAQQYLRSGVTGR